MASALPEPTPLRLRRAPDSVLREWVQERLETDGEVSANLLYPKALELFSEDRSFMEEVFEGALLRLLQDQVQAVVVKNRGRLVPLGQGVATPEHVQALMARAVARWYEATMEGSYIQLSAMTRPVLRRTIASQRRTIESQQRRLAFLAELEAGLENDQQTIADRYGEAQIAEIWRRHFEP